MQLKNLAIEMANWQTLRDLDYHWGLLSRDRNLLAKVYFGSPQPRYRERVAEAAMTEGIDLSSLKDWVWGPEQGVSPFFVTDLREMVIGDNASLQTWLPKKLLFVLTSDLYAPIRTGQIFAQVFQTEHYHPETSPDRVFQLVGRLRKILEKSELSDLCFKRGGYYLLLNPGHGIRLHRDWLDMPRFDRIDVYRSVLRENFLRVALEFVR